MVLFSSCDLATYLHRINLSLYPIGSLIVAHEMNTSYATYLAPFVTDCNSYRPVVRHFGVMSQCHISNGEYGLVIQLASVEFVE